MSGGSTVLPLPCKTPCLVSSSCHSLYKAYTREYWKLFSLAELLLQSNKLSGIINRLYISPEALDC